MNPLRLLIVVMCLLPMIAISQTIDPNFTGPIPIAKPEITSIRIQPDGKILLGGFFDLYGDESRTTLIRLNADGSLDNGFNFSLAKRRSAVYDIHVKSNGQIVVRTDYDIYTLEANGDIANTFVMAGIPYLFQIKVQPDGKTLVSGVSNGYFLRRYNEDGTLDNTFSYSGDTHVQTIELQNDKIIIAHNYSQFRRLESDGTIDPTFLAGPFTGHPQNQGFRAGIAVQPDGKIVRFHNDPLNYNFGLNSVDLIRHAESAVGEQAMTEVHGPVVQLKFYNNKMYVQVLEQIGSLTPGNSKIYRLNDDLTVDNSFTPVHGNWKMFFTGFDVASDGSVVVVNSSFDNLFGISRYSNTGAFESTFAPAVKMYGFITHAHALENQKLVVSGKFIMLDNHPTRHIGVLNADGSPDNNFAVTADHGYVFTSERAANQSILVAAENDIFKVDATGARDPSFTIERTSDLYALEQMKVLASGKIVALGPNNLYRLMPDGSQDPTFEKGGGLAGSSWGGGWPKIDMQADGKILFASIGDMWNGTPTTELKRINVDGSLDTTFPVGTGPETNSGAFTSLISLPNDGLILTGYMTEFNGTATSRGLVKLNGDGTLDETFMTNYPGAAVGGGHIQWLKVDGNRFVQSTPIYQSQQVQYVLRQINSNGALNESFEFPSSIVFKTMQDFVPFEESFVVAGEHTVNGTIGFMIKMIRPVFISGSIITEANEDTPFDVVNEDLLVHGVTPNELQQLQLVIKPGAHYTVSGNTITPEQDFNGMLSIGVELKDGPESVTEDFMSIEITPVNDAPVIEAVNAVSLTEDESTILSKSQIEFHDVDTPDAALVLEILDGDHYSVTENSILPDLNYNGPIQISIRLNDGSAASEIFIIDASVSAVNDKPIINSVTPFTMTEDVATTLSIGQVTFSDVDSSPANATVTILEGNDYSNTNNTITPTLNFNGNLEVKIKVSDGINHSENFTVVVPVTAVNDIPVISAVQNFNMTEDVPKTLTLSQVTFTDVDSAPTALELVLVDGDSYSVSGATIIPTENYTGALTVKIKLKDGADHSAEFTFTTNVQPVNDAPVVIAAEKNIKCSKSSPLTLSVSMFTITDADNTSGFTVTPVAGAGYDIVNGAIVPQSEKEQKLNVSMTASDGDKSSAVFVFEVHVLPMVVTGIESVKAEIWPNPATHVIHHGFDNSNGVHVINLSGQIVAKDELRNGSIDVSHLSPGFYFIEVADGSAARRVYKIVKK